MKKWLTWHLELRYKAFRIRHHLKVKETAVENVPRKRDGNARQRLVSPHTSHSPQPQTPPLEARSGYKGS